MDASMFEAVAGQAPHAVLGTHPSRDFIALQVSVYGDNRAGVWDANTGKLLWLPYETPALCWTPDGKQVALVRSSYQRVSDYPAMIISPLQSEYTHAFERWSWPGREFIAACPISLPTGWLDWVTTSPRGKLAVFRWMEQDCAGYEFVALGAEGDAQLAGQGVRFDSNLIEGPVFSPDGRYLVLARGRPAWWNTAHDPERRSEGGEYQEGEVFVHDLDVGTRRTLPVMVHLDAGWFPDDLDSLTWELLSAPRFVTPNEFTVPLPSGDERRFSATASF